MIAETTLTKEQAALLEWCNDRNVLVEFTSEASAIVYLRMAGRWKIGDLRYILCDGEWIPHARDADVVRCKQEKVTNGARSTSSA